MTINFQQNLQFLKKIKKLLLAPMYIYSYLGLGPMPLHHHCNEYNKNISYIIIYILNNIKQYSNNKVKFLLIIKFLLYKVTQPIYEKVVVIL